MQENETHKRREEGATYPEHTADAPQGYVVGFLFRHLQRNQTNEVALIRKARPEWQKGLLNGVGGKIEKGETSAAAMFREFKEETTVEISRWRHYARVEGPNWFVDFYAYFCEEPARDWRLELGIEGTDPDEPVSWYPVSEVLRRHDVIANLRWQIPLAIDQPLGEAEYIANVKTRARTPADLIGYAARRRMQD